MEQIIYIKHVYDFLYFKNAINIPHIISEIYVHTQ